MEHVTEGAWETLPVPLHPGVLGALRALGFPYMTPVQERERRQGRRRFQLLISITKELTPTGVMHSGKEGQDRRHER